MSSLPTEEKHPLLSFFVEDGRGKGGKENFFVERSRGRNIISGATAVLTEWPSHLTTCWLSMLLCGILLTILLLFSAAIRPIHTNLLPRCKHTDKRSVMNETTIYLVHNSDRFNSLEIAAMERMLNVIPNATLDITILYPSSALPITNNKTALNLTQLIAVENTPLIRVKRELISQNGKMEKDMKFKHPFFDLGEDFNINVGSKRLLNLLMKRRVESEWLRNKNMTTTKAPVIRSFQDIVDAHKVVMRNVTIQEYFKNTPLEKIYPVFRPELIIFAARVLKLWDYSGISFDYPKITYSSVYHPFLQFRNNLIEQSNEKLYELINVGKESFERLPEGIVTIDDGGLHMMTKTTCHAFFGEMIRNLRLVTKASTIPLIIKKTLTVFCKKNAVNSSYCEKLLLRFNN